MVLLQNMIILFKVLGMIVLNLSLLLLIYCIITSFIEVNRNKNKKHELENLLEDLIEQIKEEEMLKKDNKEDE